MGSYPMTFKEYQDKAADTVAYPGRGTPAGLNYTVLGLGGEAGEVAQKLKKRVRDHNNDVKNSEFKKDMALEISDCLWYLSALATELGFTLEEIAIMNIEKLASRKSRGTIGGSGDHR